MIDLKVLERNTVLQDRYLIVQVIGKGRFGETYLAIDQNLGEKITLKRVHVKANPQLAQLTDREVILLLNLKHPNLPKVTGYFEQDGFKFLAMEYISGDDLGKIVSNSGRPFHLEWVLFWADQLLEALNLFHSQQPPLIHKDIKPRNLKLTPDNNVILLDFGLAKFIEGYSPKIVSSPQAVQDINYASIEQLRGSAASERSDIYSLSATLYFLLTAQPPIDALTRADHLLNNLPDPVKSVNHLNPEIPIEISEVVMRGLSLAANLRYGSVKEMQRALREAYFRVKNQRVDASQRTEVQAISSYEESFKQPKSQTTRNEPKDEKTLILNESKNDEKTPPFTSTPTDEKTLVLNESSIAEKTLVLESSEEFSQKTLQESTFSPQRKKTISPEEIFPQVIPQEPAPPSEKAAELTVPLIKLDELEDKISPPHEAASQKIKTPQIRDFGEDVVHKPKLDDDIAHKMSIEEIQSDQSSTMQTSAVESKAGIGSEIGDIIDQTANEEVPAQPFTTQSYTVEQLPKQPDSLQASVTQQPHVIPQNPVGSVAVTNKRSTPVALILSVLLIMLFGVVLIAVGLYAFRDRIFSFGKSTPTPTPSVNFTPEPTPETVSTSEAVQPLTTNSNNEGISLVNTSTSANTSSSFAGDSNISASSDDSTQVVKDGLNQERRSSKQPSADKSDQSDVSVTRQTQQKKKDQSQEKKPTPTKTPERLEILQ
ncbi:MAG: serine/threonine protein kinase [Acidobacteria bacterium]|nr:MAG: serine/threonine protein kinase [Acidobacteriota bacterium]